MKIHEDFLLNIFYYIKNNHKYTQIRKLGLASSFFNFGVLNMEYKIKAPNGFDFIDLL